MPCGLCDSLALFSSCELPFEAQVKAQMVRAEIQSHQLNVKIQRLELYWPLSGIYPDDYRFGGTIIMKE